MKHSTRLGGRFAAALVGAAWATTAFAAPQSVAVPAYFYPSFPDPLWSQMQSGVPTVAFAVMNPASGSGAASDPNYVSQVAAARAAGVKVLGYVTSSYATRAEAAVKAEIDNYYAWYQVDGIFIDEADNNCPTASYYADLNSYTKTKGGAGLTVINPGTTTPECFVTSADIILTSRGPIPSTSRGRRWAGKAGMPRATSGIWSTTPRRPTCRPPCCSARPAVPATCT